MNQEAERIASQAMRAHRAGRFEEAEVLCRQVLDGSPAHHGCLVLLAVLLRHTGAFVESGELAERAIELAPDVVDGYVQLGLCLLATGQMARCVSTFTQAIKLAPNLGPLHYNLGLALENLGRTEEAIAAFVEAVRLGPTDPRARVSLGSHMLVQRELAGAREQACAAIAVAPSFAEGHLLLAKVLVAQGDGAGAEASIRRALAAEPESSFGHSMLGFRLLRKGEFEAAEAAFRKSIELDPAQGVAYFGITESRKLTESDRPLVQQMQKALLNSALGAEQARYLHSGLARAHENLGEYETAMRHYDEAHAGLSRPQAGSAERESPFDEREYASRFESVRFLYTREFIEQPGPRFESDLPIFIVGMMRSGTTLTEQILSSHPQVAAAGEHEFWARRAHLAENLAEMTVDRKQAASLAREYCRELRHFSGGASAVGAGGARHVTDKLPGNYARLGLLHMAMPNAKFIHCMRSPVDTALSIYFTANPSAPSFSHTKEGIVFAYRRYQELMDHWRTVLPSDRLYEVQYEELVAEPETTIRGMLKFLGLEWSSACLSHEKNAKEVHTPSLWQVRQPLYSTSIERWRRFEPWLGAFRELL